MSQLQLRLLTIPSQCNAEIANITVLESTKGTHSVDLINVITTHYDRTTTMKENAKVHTRFRMTECETLLLTRLLTTDGSKSYTIKYCRVYWSNH